MNEKIIQLINSLILKTDQSQIGWQRTSRSNEFKVNLSNGAVSTDRWVDNGIEYLDFRVFNNVGEEIGSWQFKFNDADFALLLSLHSTVLRKYLKIDETIDGMLGELLF